MCRLLDVHKSRFYRYLHYGHKSKKLAVVAERVWVVFEESGGSYGSRRVHQVLKAEGVCVSRKTVARIMKEQGLKARPRRRWKRPAEPQKALRPLAAQRVFKTGKGAFLPTTPATVLVGDMTYLRAEGRFFYLEAVMDVFNRAIVGWSLSSCPSSQLVVEALEKAIQGLQPQRPVLFHSDQGVQYTSEAFRQAARALGVQLSMSRRGNCYDNAYVESFFKSFKTECVRRRQFDTGALLRDEIFGYMEWYNRRRLHSALNYRTPELFLKDWQEKNRPHP